jgi:hypothetical protein
MQKEENKRIALELNEIKIVAAPNIYLFCSVDEVLLQLIGPQHLGPQIRLVELVNQLARKERTRIKKEARKSD